MKKIIVLYVLTAFAALHGAELDLTSGAEKLAPFKNMMQNIEVLPAGKDGGVIAAEAGKYAAFQLKEIPDFTVPAGRMELQITPTVGMDFFKDAKNVQSMTLLEIVWQNKNRWGFSAVLAPGYQHINASLSGKNGSANARTWKKGEKHTLLIEWKDGKVSAAVDGKIIAAAPLPQEMAKPIIVNVCGYNNTVFAAQKVTFTGKK